MPTRTIDGALIAYDEAGQGPHTLLLIHGHPFNRSMWRPQLEAIAQCGWRVIAPDLRGYGESGPGAEKTTLEVFARDAAGLMDALGVERFVLGGLSMGGQIVMEACRLFPERLRGILLAATFVRAETAEGKKLRNGIADRLLQEGMQAYAQELLPKMLAARSIEALPEVAAQVLAMMQSAPAAGAAAAIRGRAERPDYAPTLARVKVPALVVVGDSDFFTTRADAEQMHTLLAGSELLWLEGVGHMPNLEAAATFNAALGAFLARLSNRA